MKKVIVSILAFLFLLSFTSCREKTTKEKVSDAVESVGDDIKDAADDVSDEVEDAVE